MVVFSSARGDGGAWTAWMTRLLDFARRDGIVKEELLVILVASLCGDIVGLQNRALNFFLESVFLLTTNMRLFLNPIINDIFSPILICEKPFL